MRPSLTAFSAKNCFTLAVVVMSLFAVGQDRASTSPATCFSEGQKITKATGWNRGLDNGQWVANENTIRPTKVSRDSLNWLDSDDFMFLKMCRAKINGADYVILTRQYAYLDYQYPAIHEGRFNFHETMCVLLTPQEFESLKHAVQKVTDVPTTLNDLPATSLRGEFNPKLQEVPYDEAELMLRVGKLSAENKMLVTKRDITIQRTKSEGKEVVRFLLGSIGSEYSFDYRYFELPAEEFLPILPN